MQSRKSFLYQKGVPSHQAIYRISLDFAVVEKAASTRGGIVRTPCLAWACCLPLGQGSKPYTKLWKGQATIHCLPWFSPCPGCQSWCLGDRSQGARFWLTGFLDKISGEILSRLVRAMLQLTPAGAETWLCCLCAWEFCFIWHQDW